MYLSLILGNIFATFGAICVVISVAKKNKKDLIWWQIIDVIFFIFSCIALQAYAALTTNCFALIRNVLAYKNKLTLKMTFLLSLLCFVVGIYANNLGMFGALAVIATVSYTVFLYTTKNDQQMRYAIIINSILWLVHDYYIKSYPSVLTGIVFIVWTIVQIFKNRNKIHRTAKR